MVIFPNAKINLGLSIFDKRTDLFHNIETVFCPIQVCDVLEIVASGNGKPGIFFSTSGLQINDTTNDNLCVKAYYLLKKDFPALPPVLMHLHKTIPIGAGLGGGSADAAFTLKLLNKKFHLNLTQDALSQYALQLGSDCPFFIINQPVFAYGRGEIMQPIALDLSAYALHLIHPGIHINTGWVFQQYSNPLQKNKSISVKEAVQQPLNTWRNTLFNDLEPIVFEKYPAIKEIKNHLYQKGALYASMTGSGSAVFGIFEKNQHPIFEFPTNYFYKKIAL